VFIVAIPTLHRALFGGPLNFLGSAIVKVGAAAIPVSTLVLAGGLHAAAVEVPSAGAHTAQRRLALTVVVARLLVLPLLCAPVTWALCRAGVVPNDPVLRLIMFIEPAMPPSQTAVSIFQLFAPKHVAALSRLYVPAYLAAVLTVSGAVLGGVLVVGG